MSRDPARELAALRDAHLLRLLRPLGSRQSPTVLRDGRPLVNFASNDYLGLAGHPALAAAASAALDEFGTGAGASRLVTGTLPPHVALESALAELKGTEAALTFSTGYSAAVGTLTALAGKGDTVILDKLSHASLVDGARLSGATVRVFPHNHLAKLERLLAGAPTSGRTIVVTESVFSMDGDRAPLGEIATLAHRHDALLLADEAHALGVLAPEPDIPIDLRMGTFSKAAGSAGGYLCAPRDLVDLLVNRARAFIYSTAPPPAVAAASLAGLALIYSDEGTALRNKLWDNIRRLAPSASSAIIPHLVGDESEALAASEHLESAGFLAPAIRYPTVARGTARIRIAVTAAHSAEQIDALAAALELERRL